MPEIERVADLQDGVTVFFTDGAYISLTLYGVSRCSRCGVINCNHFRAAVTAFDRRKWDLAEANRENWSPKKYRDVFIDPRIFFRPGEGEIPPIDWTNVDFEILELYRPRGFLGIFADGGQIFVSSKHPYGATKCLKCGARDCVHRDRVVDEIAMLQAHSERRYEHAGN